MKKHITKYINNLSDVLKEDSFGQIEVLGKALLTAWKNQKNIYLCGNGGSAGNAIHLENDFLYGAGLTNGFGLRVQALSSNPAVITCLANDIGYENIFSEQLRVKAGIDDLLIVLSGSGNSPNVINAIEMANQIGMKTFAILGFSGGRCKEITQHPIHFDINDMQIAEDLQLIVGHICMQWLSTKALEVK